MSTVKKFNNMIDHFEQYTMGHLFEKIKISREKHITNGIKLSREQIQETNEYFLEHYGKKVPLSWHRYYMAFSGKFDKKYFPELLYIPEYDWLVNPSSYADCLADKNILPMLISGVEKLRIPETVVSCANGIYRDADMKQISSAQAAEIISDAGKLFFKIAVDSDSGRGCNIIEMREGTDLRSGRTAEEIITGSGRDFVIQLCVENPESLSRFNPSSVNTFRVISYRAPSGSVKIAPVFMRIGRNDSFLDNAHAGGIFIGIEHDGQLLDTAYSMDGSRYTEHPDTKVVFRGGVIPEFKLVRQKAIELHNRIPQLGIINFDFTLDKTGVPVLIELNTKSGPVWASQIAHGKSFFGDDTDAILEYLRDMRKLYPFNYR